MTSAALIHAIAVWSVLSLDVIDFTPGDRSTQGHFLSVQEEIDVVALDMVQRYTPLIVMTTHPLVALAPEEEELIIRGAGHAGKHPLQPTALHVECGERATLDLQQDLTQRMKRAGHPGHDCIPYTGQARAS